MQFLPVSYMVPHPDLLRLWADGSTSQWGFAGSINLSRRFVSRRIKGTEVVKIPINYGFIKELHSLQDLFGSLSQQFQVNQKELFYC